MTNRMMQTHTLAWCRHKIWAILYNALRHFLLRKIYDEKKTRERKRNTFVREVT